MGMHAPFRKLVSISLLTLLLGQPALAAVELITPDGKRVRLNDDQTWEYISSGKSKTQAEAVLRVSHVDEMEGNACRIGVILQNNLPYKIKDLAFHFTVYKSASLDYDSVTRSFFEIKPTDDQYRKVFFRGISCRDIHHILVEDPGRCSMGDLDKFSSYPGDCIEHVRVEPSRLISITK